MLRRKSARLSQIADFFQSGPEALIFAAAVVFYFAFLFAKAPGFDEGKTLVVLGLPWRELLPFLARNEPGPPLYFILVRAWSFAFGDALFAARSFSAVCLAAALIAYLSVSRRLAPRAPSAAFALACLSSLWLFAAHDARYYGLLLALGLGQTKIVLDLIEPGGWKNGRLAAYGLLSFMAVFVHYYGSFLIALHGLLLLRHFRFRRARFGAIAAMHFLLAASLCAWAWLHLGRHMHLLQGGHADRAGVPPFLRVIGAMLWEPGFLGFLTGFWVHLLGLVAFSVAAYGLRTAAGKARNLCAYYLLGGLALVWALDLASGHPFVQPRYFVAWSPFLFASLAEAAGGMSALRRRIVLGLWFSIAATGAAGYLFSVFALDPDLSNWAGIIRGRVDSRTPIVFLDSYYYHAMREYYLPERAQYLLPAFAPQDLDWESLPRYRAFPGEEILKGNSACAVVDTRRLLGGAVLSDLRCSELLRRLN